MTLSIFALSAFACLLLLSLVVVWPWLRSTPASASLLALNVSVFRERLAELEADQAAGRMDDASYQAQKLELERQLLAVTDAENVDAPRRAPRLVIGLVFLWLPLFAVAAYLLIGDRQAVFAYWQAQDQYGEVAEQLLTGQMNEPPDSVTDGVALLQAMQTHVYRNPTDAERWLAMSEAYVAVEAIEPAIEALSRAHRRAPADDRIAMTYAQMRFFSQQGQLDDKTRTVLSEVLGRNPNHEGAILLLAMGLHRAGEYHAAVEQLQQLRQLHLARGSTATSEAVVQIDRAIAQSTEALQAAQDSRLQVSVGVAETLRDQIKPSDTLFVFVRALQGAGAPYAVHKQNVAALLAGQTVQVTLSDANAMLPEQNISSAQRAGTGLAVVARISRTGNPTAAAGDLESTPVPIGTQKQFETWIDQRR
ncbi:MAG: c-type cytochrome biogenesis protein CcmI [Pseudomonadota bacterium]|nr:c-type cytochrome biogenesis protein CcmI [Pseudomonadota bacterium]